MEKTFNVSKGDMFTFKAEENCIITIKEDSGSELVPGEFYHHVFNGVKSTVIFKEKFSDDKSRCFLIHNINKDDVDGSVIICNSNIVRPATKYEKDDVLYILKEKGEYWDQDRKCIDKYRNGEFYYVENLYNKNAIIICDEFKSNYVHYHAFLNEFVLMFEDACSHNIVRLATEEEKEKMLSELNKKGVTWDEKNNCLTKKN